MILGPEKTDGGAGLGQPIGIREGNLRQSPHCPLDDRLGHRSTAIGDGPQRRRRRRARSLEPLHDACQHRGNDKRLRDAFGRDQLEPGGRVELRQHHDASSCVDRRQDRRDARDVIGRNRHERGLVLGGRAEFHRREHVRAQVTVTEHGGLRCTGGAAGEELHGDRIGILAGPGIRHGIDGCGLQKRAALRRDCSRRQPQGREHRLRSDEHGRVESREQRLELVATQAVVERHIRHPGLRRRVHRNRRRRAVDVEERERAGSLCPQPATPAVDASRRSSS